MPRLRRQEAGDLRLFIVERAGRILIYDRNAGALLPTPFLDITGKIVDASDERGMFSVAFHPDYASNKLFYVYYTNPVGDVTIERYHVTANPNVADPASGAVLLDIPHPNTNHRAAAGRPGRLPVRGIGDGGGSGDPSCLSQSGQSLFGKLLRLDVRQNLNTAPFYGIPPSNPFLAAADPNNQIRDEIWALGLRNPWRFSFDRGTGDLYIGDVGENLFEEIDLHRAAAAGGQNFGWRVMEGQSCFASGTDGCAPGTPPCNSAAYTPPIHTYPHGTFECAIAGGYFYRGSAVADLAGRYVFGDYCSGAIRTLRETSPGVWTVSADVVTGGFGLQSFGQDANGELYAAIGGTVYRLAATAPPSVPALPRSAHAALALGLMALGLALASRRRSSRRV